MPECPRSNTCAFFSADAGYSPELKYVMKSRFCMHADSTCVRRTALEVLGEGNVPCEMLPTDHAHLETLTRATL